MFQVSGNDPHGQLHAARLESSSMIGSTPVIGVQYCDANPNSLPDLGGQTSAWMSFRGTG